MIPFLLFYLGLSLTPNNILYFTLIAAFVLYLFWRLENWKAALFLTLVAVIPLPVALRSFWFNFPLAGGAQEYKYGVAMTAPFILSYVLLGELILSRSKMSFDREKIFWLLYVFWVFAACLFSPNSQLSLAGFINFFPMALAFLFARFFSADRRVKETLGEIFASLLIVEGSIALGQFLKGGPLGWRLEMVSAQPGDFQPAGTLPDKNSLAVFLGMLLLAHLAELWKTRNDFLGKWLFRLGVGLGAAGLVVTMSRWSWLVFLLAAVPILRRRGNLFPYITIIILSVAGVLLFTGRADFFSRRLADIKTVFTEEYNTFRSRRELAEEALLMIGRRPLVGVGLDNFVPQLDLSGLTEVKNYFLYPAHNWFLLLAAEAGLPALVFFLMLVFYRLRSFPSFFGVLPAIGFFLATALAYSNNHADLWLFFLLLGLF